MKTLKRTLRNGLMTLAIIVFTLATSYAQSNQDANKKAIREVIQSAYIDGIHNQGNIAAIEKGFHPGFNLLIKNKNNQLQKLPIYNWIESVERRKANNPEGPKEKTTVEFIEIDVTGDAGMAKIDLYRGKNKIYTDYLFLYNFEDTWRIVSKVYHGY